MQANFEIITFLNKVLKSGQTGRVYIAASNVEWCLDIVEERLVSAAHSLQYLNTLETILSGLGYDALLPVYWRLTQLKSYQRKIDQTNVESLGWSNKIVSALLKYNLIKIEQAEKILTKLTEDAVESLLGLASATVVWSPLPQKLWYATTGGTKLDTLVDYLSVRLQAWQSLSDLICSPYQRPYCENLDDLYKPGLKEGLSPQRLESLVRLMQGASIRQLAQTIKQDEVELAKSLYPHIEQQVIKLWPPLQPFACLPQLPVKGKQLQPALLSRATAPQEPHAAVVVNKPLAVLSHSNDAAYKAETAAISGNSEQTESKSVQPENNFLNNGSNPFKTKHLIICIDDSKAMLEKIESYLDSEYFELKTVIDPVRAISKICTRKPSLVLMDISMPGISGNSLCSILKRSYMFKDVPFIMMSGNSGALNKAKAEVSGAAGYLEKPFSKAKLMEVMSIHLKLDLEPVG